MKYISGLLARMSQMSTNGHGPDAPPIQEGEVIIGEVPIELRPLNQIMIEAKDALREFHMNRWSLDVILDLSPEDRDSLFREHTLLHDQADFIDKMFWLELQTAVPEAYPDDTTGLGIRENWAVVRIQENRAMPAGMPSSIMSLDSLEDLLFGDRPSA